MNTIERFKEQDRQYNIARKKYEVERDKRYSYFDNINIEEIEMLSYEETKELINISPYIYSSDNQVHNKLKEISLRKKYEKYPELNQAVYYPELNDIDFLTKEKVKELDSELRFASVNHCIFPDTFRRKFDITTDEAKKILNFLYENKIISKYYRFICPECNSGMEAISEKDLKKYQEPYDSDRDDYYLPLYCMDCDEYSQEFNYENYDELIQLPKDIIYKRTKMPDLSKEGI